MRQAGRRLPQFREIRAKYSFMGICRQPELAARVTRLPVDLLGVDAAVLFSDILVVAEALGLGLQMRPKVGPVIERPVRTEKEVARLPDPDVREMLGYVAQGIRCVKPQLKVPLIGFCGAPFTVACYLVQGRSGEEMGQAKKWMFRHPRAFHRLLEKVAYITIECLKMQAEAGADALQVFDSWGGGLGYRQFAEFSLPYLRKILEALSSIEIPKILYCRGGMAERIAALRPNGISVDHHINLPLFAESLPSEVAVQGNFDVDILYAPGQTIVKEAENLLNAMRGFLGYIFNVNRGLKPDIPFDSLRVLVDYVKHWK